MHPSAVKEHGGKGRQEFPRVPGKYLQEAERDDPVGIDEVRQPFAQGQLIKKHGAVQGDQPVIDVRDPGRRDRIFQRYDGNAPSMTGYLLIVTGATQFEKGGEQSDIIFFYA
jgi:hypothetical protein